MNIFHYHPETGAFVSQDVADLNPLENDKFLIPAHATTSPPPTVGEGYAAVFTDGAWSTVADHRGETWFKADGQEQVIKTLGDPRLNDLLPEMPVLPAFPDLETAYQAMLSFIARFEDQVVGYASEREQLSWASKEAEARAWVADNSANTPILSAEVSITGETMEAITASVIAKADAFSVIVGQIAGLRRAVRAQLEAATDPFDYEAVLNTAQTQAAAMAAAHGITIEA